MKYIFYVIFLTLSIFSQSSRADFIVKDFLKNGDALLVYDTFTGLYWLKPSYLNGGADPQKLLQSTYDIIYGRTQNVTDPLYGFRYANAGDVSALLVEFNIGITNDNNYHAALPAEVDGLQLFFGTFGVTYSSISWNGKGQVSVNGWIGTTCKDFKISAVCFYGYENYHYISSISANTEMSPVGKVSNIFSVAKAGSNYNYYSGHFLVSSVNPSKLK